MQAQIISFYCILKNRFGLVLGESYNHDILTTIEDDELFLAGLINGLKNIKAGERREIFVAAQDAYGFYQMEKLKRIDVLEARHAKIGDTVYLAADTAPYRVIKIEQNKIILDGNHPLAGQDLIFEIEALKVRDAEVDEIPLRVINSESLFH